MVSIIKILFLLLLIQGCAKVEYLWDQGRGQLKMLTRAKDNQKVLDDVTIDPADKNKVRLIMKYKKYFYEYWDKKPADIYNKTYFLDQEAVTYLVIASPFDKIEARKECFPIMGCFPYLGFFSLSKAKEFAADLEREEWVTHTRPVYAYSSLGYFSDPILSSFFYYDDRQLAELIFHELFHTIFFAKDEVNFNENLANYFAKEMTAEYFGDNAQKAQKLILNARARKKVNRKIVALVKELNEKYKREKPASKSDSFAIFNNFIENRFRPALKKYCVQEQISSCYGLKRNWNNASFVAFLTYEEQESKISQLHKKLGVGLKDYFKHIVGQYQKYESSDKDSGFEKYLFNE